MMSVFWVCSIGVSLVFALLGGRLSQLNAAAVEGAKAAVELCFSIAGPMMFWSGIMEVMRSCGMMDALSRLLSPVLRLLFPKSGKHPEVLADISANVSANLLGLGNAATPAGIRAARGMQRISGGESASDELCMLVVVNTASLQLIPTTIGAVRASCGAANPFDIMPAVWLASVISQAAGILSALIFAKLWRRRSLNMGEFLSRR